MHLFLIWVRKNISPPVGIPGVSVVGTASSEVEKKEEEETSHRKEEDKNKVMQLISKVSQALKDFKTAAHRTVDEKLLESKQRFEEKVVKSKLKKKKQFSKSSVSDLVS